MDKPDVSLDVVFPSQNKFLGDLLSCGRVHESYQLAESNFSIEKM